MCLPKENQYALTSTRGEATVIEEAEATYLEICANLQQIKTYFSATKKEGVENFLSFRMCDVERGHIVKGRHATTATHLRHFLNFIGNDNRLKAGNRNER